MTQFPHSRVYREQNASRQVIASGGTLLVEAGGAIDVSAGAITLPGTLGRGYIPLTIIGAKTTATASGIVAVTELTTPTLVNPDITSGYLALTWGTASQQPAYFAPVRVPDDLATGGGMTFHLVASGAAANATNAFHIALRNGTATADVIAGTSGNLAVGAAAAETTLAISSGNTPATGFMSFSIFPENAHASGAMSYYAAGLSYRRRTS